MNNLRVVCVTILYILACPFALVCYFLLGIIRVIEGPPEPSVFERELQDHWMKQQRQYIERYYGPKP